MSGPLCVRINGCILYFLVFVFEFITYEHFNNWSIKKIFTRNVNTSKTKMKNGSLTTKVMTIEMMILVLKKEVPQMRQAKN